MLKKGKSLTVSSVVSAKKRFFAAILAFSMVLSTSSLDLRAMESISESPVPTETVYVAEENGYISNSDYPDASLIILDSKENADVQIGLSAVLLPGGLIGAAYSHQLEDLYGLELSWTIESGTLPTGLNLSTEGLIFGTPTAAGTFTFFVRATMILMPGVSNEWEMSITVDYPNFSLDIFNNGPGGTPSRPNPGLMNIGRIRMWTQLNGINSLVPFAELDITAVLPDGTCAMEFIIVNRLWNDPDNVNHIDADKHAPWQRIYLTATLYGQTVEVILVNSLSFSLSIFNNGPGGTPSIPNQSLADAGLIRMWTQLGGTNADVTHTAMSAIDQDGNDAMDFIRINRVDGLIRSIDANKNAPWQYIEFSITVRGQTIDVLLVNSLFGLHEPPEITTDTLPNGRVDVGYSATLAATGDAPIVWTLDSGTLPNGLALSTDGVISGTPTLAGVFTFTVRATNDGGYATRTFTVEIYPAWVAPEITTDRLSAGIRGWAYSQTLQATGDTPIVWTLDSGTLPTGLTLSPDGVISGTTTVDGIFTFTVRATNDGGYATRTFTVTIHPPIILN